MVLFDLSLSRSSSDSEIQRKKWVPNQDQNVSCTRDEMSRTPPNKLMGRVDMCFSDFNCNDTWWKNVKILLCQKGLDLKAAKYWECHVIIQDDFVYDARSGFCSVFVSASLQRTSPPSVAEVLYFSVFQLYPQFFESILWLCQWAMRIKDTTFHQPTKQRSKRLTWFFRPESPIVRTRFFPQVFTVRLQRSSSGTLGLQLRGLDVVTWHETAFWWEKNWGWWSNDLQRVENHWKFGRVVSKGKSFVENYQVWEAYVSLFQGG